MILPGVVSQSCLCFKMMGGQSREILVKKNRRSASVQFALDIASLSFPGSLKRSENVMFWFVCAVSFGFLSVLSLAVLFFVRLLSFSLS